MARDDEPKALLALFALALALYALAWTLERPPEEDREPLGDTPVESAAPHQFLVDVPPTSRRQS